MTARPSPLGRVLLLLVRGYRLLLSPLLPARCRFAPSCSRYALDAIETHGALRGGWLAVRRVVRCHPFHPGGHDPVPPARRAGENGTDPVPARPAPSSTAPSSTAPSSTAPSSTAPSSTAPSLGART